MHFMILISGMFNFQSFVEEVNAKISSIFQGGSTEKTFSATILDESFKTKGKSASKSYDVSSSSPVSNNMLGGCF